MNEWERPGPTVVAVTTPTCVNCRAMKPLVAATAEDYDGDVALVDVDAAADPARAAALGVRGVPTYIAFRDGTEQVRRTGRMSEAEVRALFDAAASGGDAVARISSTDRFLRLAVAGTFAIVGVVTATPALFVLAAVLVAFGLWDLLPRR